MDTGYLKLCAIDLDKKEKICEDETKQRELFSFKVSPDFKFLILTSADNKVTKIDCSNPKLLNVVKVKDHDLGKSNGIYFDSDSKYFMTGSSKKKDVYIY